MAALAPEPILRAALFVLHQAAITTRNWALRDEISRKQICDLWEAIHEIPDLIRHWDEPQRCETELMMYLREYDSKWPVPKLEALYDYELKRILGNAA